MFEEQRNQIQGSKSAHLEFAQQEYACATTNRKRGPTKFINLVEGSILNESRQRKPRGIPLNSMILVVGLNINQIIDS